jgi:hypothetical protein
VSVACARARGDPPLGLASLGGGGGGRFVSFRSVAVGVRDRGGVCGRVGATALSWVWTAGAEAVANAQLTHFARVPAPPCAGARRGAQGGGCCVAWTSSLGRRAGRRGEWCDFRPAVPTRLASPRCAARRHLFTSPDVSLSPTRRGSPLKDRAAEAEAWVSSHKKYIAKDVSNVNIFSATPKKYADLK